MVYPHNVFECLVRPLFFAKPCHIAYIDIVSPNGVLPCGLLRIICYEYAMSHGLHLYDFSPECVFEKHFMVINLSKKHCYFEYIDIVSPQVVNVVL